MNRSSSAASGRFTVPAWGLLLLTGILLGLAYPPNPVGGLFGALGLVPLLLALEQTTSYKQAFRWSYGSFFIFSAISTWWVGSWQSNSDPWLMTSCILLIIVHPLFFVVPILLYLAVRRASTLSLGLIFLPLLWCGGEYLHALTDASYPWLTLGNTQTYNLYYIQFIEYTGIWGVSLLMLIQNCTVAWLLLARPSTPEGPQVQRLYRTGGIILAATIILPYLHGITALAGTDKEEKVPENSGSYITITVVQPNQNPWDKWKQDDPTDHIQDNGELSLQAKAQSGKVDMYLWAENAIPYPITHPNYEHRRADMYRTVDSLGVPVMTGFPDYVEHRSKEEAAPSSRRDSVRNPSTGTIEVKYWDFYNSIGVFAPGGRFMGSYHKTQLVPFGERIPFVDAAPFLIDMLSWDVGISSWGKGKSIHPVPVPVRGNTVMGGGMVCFESVYPNIVRQFVDKGAEFLTIVTNDGWYLGTPGPLQHERFAILRAIETRRGIARAANTGISCFVTPEGRIFGETAEGARITTTGTIPLREDKTIYVRWGNWLPILSLIGAAGIGLWAWLERRRKGVRA